MVKTIEEHIDEIFNLLYGSKKNNKGETGLMYIRMHLAARIMVSMNCSPPTTRRFLRTICLHTHRLLPT